MNEVKEKTKGAIAWMTRNHVTANLLMLAFIVGGLLMTGKIKQEVFPDLQLDMVIVTVPYPGASPEEVEEGILVAIEEEVRGLDNIKKVTSVAREGVGSVWVELLLGSDPNKALSDVQNAVDRVKTFPQDIERYTVSLAQNKRHVISVILHGNQPERVLKKMADDIREGLIGLEDVTQVEISGIRKPEISVEVSQKNLRKYNLTLEDVAAKIKLATLDLPGGRVKTEGGEILVRITEKKYVGEEYENIPIIIRNDGTVVTLKDIGVIKDSFEDSDVSAQYNGEPAVRIDVFRVGDETPAGVSAAVKEYVEKINKEMPDTIHASVWEDMSDVLQDRINLLLKNAGLGLILVLLLLGLALDIRLAFWVTMGIPTSVLGAMLFFPLLGLSINMVSLFAIIVTIGIVVDDAVIIGENVYYHRKQGKPFLQAAIDGARQMAVPVTFSIVTNIAAFLPLLFVPGVTGKIFKVIPTAVIMIFLISLIDALFVVPAHLSKKHDSDEHGIIGWLNVKRQWFGNFLMFLRDKTFKPSLVMALKWRYITLALALALLMLSVGMVKSGRINFSFMPKVEADRVTLAASMPFGTSIDETSRVREVIMKALYEVIDNNGGDSLYKGIYSQLGAPPAGGGMVSIGSNMSGAHLANVSVYLVPMDARDITAEQFVSQWHEKVRNTPGVEKMSFSYTTGPSSNQPINFMLSHPDKNVLEMAASDMAEQLEQYAGIRDIDDGYSGGKSQLDFKIKPSARSVGLTSQTLARQVRSAFYGAEAMRIQRDRDEVKVMVRLPENERQSEFNIEELILRTPQGTEIPLKQAAEVTRGRSYTEIKRSDGRRVLNVTADVDKTITNENKIVASAEESIVPEMLKKYPGLSFEMEGEQLDKIEAMQALGFGFILCMFAIYALLAIPFKSYTQPFIIMMSIPFGIIGAVIGHILMGYELSIISMFGIIALAGVVVNDSLILINTANDKKEEGATFCEAVIYAATRRFRPIILTSLTTFLGLAPMIFETSMQARFLIPMAISLGYGILFATAIALIIIPSLYMVLGDIHNLFSDDKEDVTVKEC